MRITISGVPIHLFSQEYDSLDISESSIAIRIKEEIKTINIMHKKGKNSVVSSSATNTPYKGFMNSRSVSEILRPNEEHLPEKSRSCEITKESLTMEPQSIIEEKDKSLDTSLAPEKQIYPWENHTDEFLKKLLEIRESDLLKRIKGLSIFSEERDKMSMPADQLKNMYYNWKEVWERLNDIPTVFGKEDSLLNL